ncbi:Toxin HigB-2 [Thiorhodovibrio winogradskyi]|uniref:Toxin HigB-2 n=1 Tax=Thiorhodovibrio winogradskyi TaxID=77007 RepID=A0ABZ0SIR4_9GAMM|nr:type II toxin-antitoxin system RelE/ParE family toxin [Thiorhodovibrio winogradskyi]
MEFIETPTFTRLLNNLLTDDEYRVFQNVLVEKPDRGDLIKGGGGIRKLRHALPGRGKSGGVRIIYYWIQDAYQIYLLLIYSKSRKDSLTDQETALLRQLVKEL